MKCRGGGLEGCMVSSFGFIGGGWIILVCDCMQGVKKKWDI